MANVELIERELSYSIGGAFLDSYYKLGFGFLEVIYCRALEKELVKRGHQVVREADVKVVYDGDAIGRYRVDMIVDQRVILEIKSSEVLPPFTKRQLMNYLRSSGLQLGIILHYGPTPKSHRVITPHCLPRIL